MLTSYDDIIEALYDLRLLCSVPEERRLARQGRARVDQERQGRECQEGGRPQRPAHCAAAVQDRLVPQVEGRAGQEEAAWQTRRCGDSKRVLAGHSGPGRRTAHGRGGTD